MEIMVLEQELFLNIKNKLIYFTFFTGTFFFLGCSKPAINSKPSKKTLPEYCPFHERTVLVFLDHGYGELQACENFKVKRLMDVSGGEPSQHKTIRGNFHIQRKYRKYDSKKYPSVNGGRNMDYAQFFFNGFALHVGNINKYSHGCVRVQRQNAKWLFDWTNIGTSVIIKDIAQKELQ